MSIVAWHVPFAAHDVVDVVACLGCFGSVFACADAEFGRGHKVGPFVVLLHFTKAASENQASMRVTQAISTMRIELSSFIPLRNIHLGKVAPASNLNIIRSLDEVRTLDRPIWNKPSAIAGLGTPRHDNLLDLSDGRILAIRVRRSPETEVFYRVDVEVLAQRCLAVLRPTFVSPNLVLFSMIGSVVGKVGCGILGVYSGRHEQWDGREGKANHRGVQERYYYPNNSGETSQPSETKESREGRGD